MKNLIMIALLGGASLCANAQSNTKPAPQPDSLIKIVYEGRHQMYTIGGRLVPLDDVRMKLAKNPASAAEYNKARTDATWAYVSLGASAVTSTAALIAFSKTNKLQGAVLNNDGTITYQQHSHTAAYVLTGAATAFLFSSFFNMIGVFHHGQRAINNYNKQFE